MSPPDARAGRPGVAQLLQQAARYQQAGQYAQAELAARTAYAIQPRNPEVLFALGWLTGQMGNKPAGIELLKKCVQLDPQRAVAWQELGIMHQHIAQPEEAINAYERAMFLNPRLVDSYAACSMVHEKMRQPEKSRAVLEKGLKKNPGDAQLTVFLAELDAREGRADEARAALERVVVTSKDPAALVRAWHALGTARDKQGEHVAAFAAFAESNRMMLATPTAQHCLAITDSTYLAEIRAYHAISAEQLAAWGKVRLSDGLPDPGMLIGFPRSGTTMTEQALGVHSKVRTLDERSVLWKTEREARRVLEPDTPPSVVPSPEKWAALLDGASDEALTQIRRFYWEEAKRDSGIDVEELTRAGQILIDKNPQNIARISLVARIFPHARTLVMIRDPRDCCISAFTQRFGLNPGMVNFLSLDRTAMVYELMMGEWLRIRELLALPMLVARYEDTVEDFPVYARRMVEFFGLQWEPDVLGFHEKAAKKFVSTPSFRDVARPVYTTAKARWKRYPGCIDSILPRLAPFVKAFHYEL